MNAVSASGTWESMMIVLLSSGAALVSLGWTCWVRSMCVESGACVADGTDDSGSLYPSVCAFRNLMDPSVAAAYHRLATSSLAALTRGTCGVGEQQVTSRLSNKLECVSRRPFPNALNVEVQDLTRSIPHERACGKWLGSGVAIQAQLEQTPEYLSMYDEGERVAELRRLEATLHAGRRVATTNVARFTAACRRAVTAGGIAIDASARAAYAHLIRETAVESASLAEQALGVIVGHYCEAPVSLSWRRHGAKDAYVVHVDEGELFDAKVLGDALWRVGEAVEHQRRAEDGSAFLRTAVLRGLGSVGSGAAAGEALTFRRALLTGAFGPAGEDDDSAWERIRTVNSAALTAFDAFTQLPDATKRSFVRGVAAVCTATFSSLLAGDDGATTTATTASASRIGEWTARVRSARPALEALGQLSSSETRPREPLLHVSEDVVRNASAARITQLMGVPSRGVDSTCLALARSIFPDVVTRTHFALVVTPPFYERLATVVRDVRNGVVSALSDDGTGNERLRGVLPRPDAVSAAVNATRVRISGAPSGTWAGSDVPPPEAVFASDDGVITMAAKQTRAHFLQRFVALALHSGDVCDQPPSLSPLLTNAYIFPSLRCSYYLLGMLMPPWADELYDDESLYARFGYIIGHELAHTNLGIGGPSYSSATATASELFQSYPYRDSTKNEAFADILGAVGVLRTGKVNRSALCMHVSQLWCARVPIGYEALASRSHPLAVRPTPPPSPPPVVSPSPAHPRAPPQNLRGDSLCDTLDRLFYDEVGGG